MRKYELTYLVSDEIKESDLNKVTGKVTGFVKELGGNVTKEDIWGRRKLAYPIKKQDFATYVTLYFDLPALKAIEFEKDLRHIDGILRQLMIVKEEGKEKLELTAEDIAATEDIKDVIGGEKSFEAVEGETEDSRKLMAKREEETKDEKEEIVEEKVEAVEEKSEQPVVSSEESVEAENKKLQTANHKPQASKKPAKKKEEEKVNDEVERLSKLNDELDDILKDEL